MIIGRRLRFHINPNTILGIERLIDDGRYNLPYGESRLYDVQDQIGMVLEKNIGIPKLNAFNTSTDQILCFPEYFHIQD